MTILITGACGFIGSNLVASLNEAGIDDIIVQDINFDAWQNLAKRRWRKFISRELENSDLVPVKCFVHLGAITDTQETSSIKMLKANVQLPLELHEMCRLRNIPFIYASSAAVYGDGSKGFSESTADLRPLNLYGWSKLLFDRGLWKYFTTKVVGLRLFNVYGPNEYHKGKMASVLCQQFDRPRTTLFDGPFKRDFVYVEDVVSTIRWFIDHPDVSGIFNVGTGEARPFEDMMYSVFAPIDRIPMSKHLVPAYQQYTQADLTNLRAVGCNVAFRDVKEGAGLYVLKYLSARDRYR